jgi:diguanylate cyclase (GGDEF)-like protein
MTLDYPTLLVVSSIITAILAGAQLIVWWSNREIPEMAYWFVSSLFTLCIFFLYPIVSDLPDEKFLALIATAASCGSFMFNWAGVRVFASKPPFARPAVILVTLYIILAAIVLLILRPNNTASTAIYARVLFQSPMMALLCLLIAHELFRLPAKLKDPAVKVVCILFFLEGLFFIARAFVAIKFLLVGETAQPSYFIFSISFLQFSVFLMALNIGFLVMTTTRLQGQLRLQASTDALTGVPNRRAFTERAELEFKRSRRNGSPLSVVLIDLDHFKKINDTHGHLGGDAVLKAVATKLARDMRCTDLFCRWGGEEFCALLPDTDAAGAQTMLDRLRAQVATLRFEHQGHNLAATISVGIAQLAREDNTLDQLIARADKALYTAKSAGRNRVEIQPTQTFPPVGGSLHPA